MSDISKGVAVFVMGAIGVLGALIGLSALFSVPTYYLWNGLMPKLFGLTHVTFMQAWGLNLLAGFMFGGKISKK